MRALSGAVLPRVHRLTDASAFRETVRGRSSAAAGRLVVHLGLPPAEHQDAAPVRAGLVVNRAVGPAVARSRVKRRLRHLLVPRLAALPAGTSIVVRARPGAAEATSRELGSDLDRALERALRRGGTPPTRAVTPERSHATAEVVSP